MMLKLFKQWSHCLVIEQLEEGFQVVSARLNFSDKKIRIKDYFPVNDVFEVEKPFKFKKFDRLIFILNPRHAATIESVIALKRPQPYAVINETELDHLIFKSFWEFLNFYRGWSAKKLGLRDSDLILANIGILGVKLGGQAVLKPVGFRGADFSVVLKGTFMSRNFLPCLDYFRDHFKEFLIFENGSLFYNVMSKQRPHVVYSGDVKTSIFSRKNSERLFSREIIWGHLNVINRVRQLLGVDEVTARDLINVYVQNSVSGRTKRFFDNIWQEEFKKFFKAIGNISARFVFNYQLPKHGKWLNKIRDHSFVSYQNLKEQGFEVIVSKRAKSFVPELNHAVLMALVDNYIRPEYNHLDQMLKRRARWLIPNL